MNILLCILAVLIIISNVVRGVIYVKCANKKVRYIMTEIKAIRKLRYRLEREMKWRLTYQMGLN